MARLRFLRGTWLDPFRSTHERKLERRLIAEFEADVEIALSRLTAANHAAAVRLLGASETIKGYGRVKEASAAEAAKARAARAHGNSTRRRRRWRWRHDGEGQDDRGDRRVRRARERSCGGGGEGGARPSPLLDYAPSPPAGLAERLGPEALLVGRDRPRFARSGRDAMAQVKARFGRIDALLNIAGGFRWEKIADAPTTGRGTGCSR